MTPEGARHDPEAVIPKAEAAAPRPDAPGCIQRDAPAGHRLDQSSGSRSGISADDNKGLPRLAHRCGCALGFIAVGWLAASVISSRLAQGGASLNDWLSEGFQFAVMGTVAAVTFGGLFWGLALIAQAVYRSIRNAHDPVVRRMQQSIEAADDDSDDETDFQGDDPPPDLDPGIQTKP